jgi:hypothetical protein
LWILAFSTESCGSGSGAGFFLKKLNMKVDIF